MAFNVDTSVYNRIVPLGDVMQQQQDRAMQRGMMEQQMRTGDLAQQQAEEAIKEKKILQTIRLLTPETYASGGRQALIDAGIPEGSLPGNAPQEWIDQVQTRFGVAGKSKLRGMIDPDLGPIVMDENAGEYVKAREAGQPLSQRIMPPQIQTQDVPPPTQYDIDMGMINRNTPDAAISGGQPTIDDLVTAGRGAQLPQQIPDTPPTNQPQMTQIPQPALTGSRTVDRDLARERGKAIIETTKPLTEKEKADIAIRQAPIDAAKESRQRAQTGFDSIMADMNQVYDDLDAAGAATSENKTWDENLGIYVTKTNPVAQAIGGLTGTKAQSIIQRLDPLKTRAKEQIMLATGMSSKAIDSNAEMKAFLDSLTNVTNTREANAFTINTMQRLYGTPELAAARDAAIKSGQIKPMDFSNMGKSSSSTSGSSSGGAPSSIRGSIPPMESRVVGQVYTTPKGDMIWRGNGWEPAY